MVVGVTSLGSGTNLINEDSKGLLYNYVDYRRCLRSVETENL